MLFQEKGCVDCHKGNLSLERRAAFGSVSQVAAAMWNHSSSMKQSSELRPEEMKRLTGYIWALRFASEGGDAAHGARVFDAKGCGSCHTNGPGPKIAGMVPDSYTLIASLTEHAPRMMQKLESTRQAWPTTTPSTHLSRSRWPCCRGSARGSPPARAGAPHNRLAA